MTSPNRLPEECYRTLLSSLELLAQGCPGLPTNTPSLHRLGELATAQRVLDALENRESSVAAGNRSLAGSLDLVSSAQGLVKVLQDGGAVSPLGPEMARKISEALGDLWDHLGAALRRQQAQRVRGLYVIIDPEVTGGRDPLEIARGAINGGARMLQLRDKLRDKGQSLVLAQELQRLCQAGDVLLIINDHIDLAAAVGSGGVHVGQTDMPVAQARRLLAPHQVLGRSNRELDQLVESQQLGADHVAFGPIYPTVTKSTGRQPQGPERLRQAREATSLPLVAIGGINAENVAPVVAAGADAVCVTAAVGAAADPEVAAHRLVEAMRRAGGRV